MVGIREKLKRHNQTKQMDGNFIGLIILILLYVFYVNVTAYDIINWWNIYLSKVRDQQNWTDSIDPINIPGLQYAHKSQHPSIVKLNQLIKEKHEIILSEVQNLLRLKYNGMPMWEIDAVQARFKESASGWRPIWVKFMDQYTNISEHLPTLKDICQQMGHDLFLLHISLFLPGTVLEPHYGICKGHYRYHYGLQIPEGDLGLRIHNGFYRWKTGEGVQFDDTYLHSSWNRTDQIRLVIFADIVRQMNPLKQKINRGIYLLLQRTAHIKSIQERLARENIRID